MTIIRYVVQTTSSPDAPLRILDLFAQQALIVDRIETVRRAGAYHIHVELSGLSMARVEIILEKMRSMVMVEAADVSVSVRDDPVSGDAISHEIPANGPEPR